MVESGLLLQYIYMYSLCQLHAHNWSNAQDQTKLHGL